MLKAAVISEIANGLVHKRLGRLVVVSRYYPRFLARDRIHEYVAALAPAPALLKEFNAAAKRLGHNAAFRDVDYERRFALRPAGLDELARLSGLSETKDVYLACFCARGECCHRDLLLLTAAARFGARVEEPRLPYARYRERLASAAAEEE